MRQKSKYYKKQTLRQRQLQVNLKTILQLNQSLFFTLGKFQLYFIAINLNEEVRVIPTIVA